MHTLARLSISFLGSVYMCICVRNEREIWLLFKEYRRVLAAACVYVVFIKQCNVYIRLDPDVYFLILRHYDVMSVVKPSSAVCFTNI